MDDNVQPNPHKKGEIILQRTVVDEAVKVDAPEPVPPVDCAHLQGVIDYLTRKLINTEDKLQKVIGIAGEEKSKKEFLENLVDSKNNVKREAESITDKQNIEELKKRVKELEEMLEAKEKELEERVAAAKKEADEKLETERRRGEEIAATQKEQFEELLAAEKKRSAEKEEAGKERELALQRDKEKLMEEVAELRRTESRSTTERKDLRRILGERESSEGTIQPILTPLSSTHDFSQSYFGHYLENLSTIHDVDPPFPTNQIEDPIDSGDSRNDNQIAARNSIGEDMQIDIGEIPNDDVMHPFDFTADYMNFNDEMAEYRDPLAAEKEHHNDSMPSEEEEVDGTDESEVPPLDLGKKSKQRSTAEDQIEFGAEMEESIDLSVDAPTDTSDAVEVKTRKRSSRKVPREEEFDESENNSDEDDEASVKKSKPNMSKESGTATPQCVLCEKFPKTVFGYAAHLKDVHKSNLTANGVYLICCCGLQVHSHHRIPNHSKECGGRSFTLHKLGEKATPKTPRCVMCEAFPTTAYGYAFHLETCHKSSLKANGLFLLCSCGIEVRCRKGGSHQKTCDRLQFTLHKLDEKTKPTTPQCVQCETYPTTLRGYIDHLQIHHKSTLKEDGVYLLCSCGLRIRSKHILDQNHSKKCDGRDFTLHKLSEQ